MQSMHMICNNSGEKFNFYAHNKDIILSFLGKIRNPKRYNCICLPLQQPYNSYTSIENQMDRTCNEFFRAHKKMLHGDHKDLLGLLYGMSLLGDFGYQIMMGSMCTVLKPESIQPTLEVLKILSVDKDYDEMNQEIMDCLTKYQQYCAVLND